MSAKPSRKRRLTTRIACNACRTSKTACDGERPTCSRCQAREEVCEYDTSDPEESRSAALRRRNQHLEDRLAAYERIFPQLKDLPQPSGSQQDRVSLEKATVLPPTSLLTTSLGDLSFISEHSINRALLPVTSSRLDYQLRSSHATLFPSYPDPESDSAGSRRSSSTWSAVSPPSPGSQLIAGARGHRAPHAPHHQPSPIKEALCDPRLQELDISYWTRVQISNQAAINTIALYLSSEQPIVGFLDADLFVGDLVAKRHRFCSRFLVCSLLYWAAHSYKITYEDVPVEAFREAAIEEWDNGDLPCDCTTVVGAFILSVCAISDGRIQTGDYYMDQVFSMCERLNWFGSPFETPQGLNAEGAAWLRADAHASWGIFNYTTVTSFYTQKVVMESPPRFPVPGDGGVIAWLDDGTTAVYHQLPDYMDRTFTAACQFFLIANQITLQYLSGTDSTAHNDVSLDFAEHIYQRLLDWSDRAKIELTGKGLDPQHKVILHMWMHCRILDLFRPLLEHPQRLKTFGYRESTTRDLYTSSLNQLKRLIGTFPSWYPSSVHSVWFSLAMIQATSSIIGDPLDPQCRFWFVFCIHVQYNLTLAWPLLSQMLRVFIGMAIEKGIVSEGEAESILQRLSTPPGKEMLRSDYVLDLGLALHDRDKARMDSLALAFDEKFALREGRR